MNLMLPYETGIVPWRSEDPGASASADLADGGLGSMTTSMAIEYGESMVDLWLMYG